MSIYKNAHKDVTNIVNSRNINDFIQFMMKWHFSDSTGTPFWLKKRKELNFDPLRDVTSFEDLAMFPDCSSDLRTVDVHELIPRGLPLDLIPRVYESGGTTGQPKFVVAFEEWIRQLVDWRVSSYINKYNRPSGNTLAAVPTGPHIVGAINRERAERLGGMCFTVDIDPRWVKLAAVQQNNTVRSLYSEHLIHQMSSIILNQDITFLVTTPPILDMLLSQENIVERLRQTLSHITLGGTAINIDTIRYAKSEILPECNFSASYGSTSGLGESHSGILDSTTESITYNSFAPYITYRVVDNQGKSVSDGERGQIALSHLSLYAFYPNIYERDSAILSGVTDYGAGAIITDVLPTQNVNGISIIEGVY